MYRLNRWSIHPHWTMAVASPPRSSPVFHLIIHHRANETLTSLDPYVNIAHRMLPPSTNG